MERTVVKITELPEAYHVLYQERTPVTLFLAGNTDYLGYGIEFTGKSYFFPEPNNALLRTMRTMQMLNVVDNWDLHTYEDCWNAADVRNKARDDLFVNDIELTIGKKKRKIIATHIPENLDDIVYAILRHNIPFCEKEIGQEFLYKEKSPLIQRICEEYERQIG